MSSPSLGVIAREWGRIGCVGFGGPPAHIALLRRLVVERRGWIADDEVEDAVAATGLLPGPSSTQLAIWTAWRLGGPRGAIVGGLAFITPGLVLILALAALFLGSPPRWVAGAGAGAGAVVAAVAVHAAAGLLPASLRRTGGARRARWAAYVVAGGAATALVGAWVVLVLVACGAVEALGARGRRGPLTAHAWPAILAAAGAAGGVLALCWTALKVGALSYGGGFVIIPLMQADAVERHGWMTGAEFLNAVALGQVTPGPVVHTVAVVGYAAHGLGGALLATVLAFGPSFVMVLLGGRRLDALRADVRVRAFLDGAGPAAIGAIGGSAIPLALELSEAWQWAVLAAGAVALLALRAGVVATLLGAGAVGTTAVLAGAPLPGG
jgi:chromate transporter